MTTNGRKCSKYIRHDGGRIRDRKITTKTKDTRAKTSGRKRSTERRKELCKQAKKASEEFKVQIRNIRRDGNDDLKKIEKGKVSEDSISETEDNVQELTNSYIKQIDEITKNKEVSIMEI